MNTWYKETQIGIVVKRNPSLDEYCSACREQAERRNRMPWVVGGLINKGSNQFGEDAPGAWDLFHDYDDGTIANYASVEARVPMENRREDLSFGHHAVVAGIKDKKEQKKWLDRCAKENWRRDEFRRQVKGLPEKDEVQDTLNSILRGIDRLLDLGLYDWWPFLKIAKSTLLDMRSKKPAPKPELQTSPPVVGGTVIPS
jgi:hypothetical protein